MILALFGCRFVAIIQICLLHSFPTPSPTDKKPAKKISLKPTKPEKKRVKKHKKRALVLEIPRLLLVAERGLVKTSHLRALFGAIIQFGCRAQIIVIRVANDKEVWRRFNKRKRKATQLGCFSFWLRRGDL